MHSAYGTGALAWSRRQNRRHPSQCRKCEHIEESGLIDGLCNRCFGKKLDREAAQH